MASTPIPSHSRGSNLKCRKDSENEPLTDDLFSLNRPYKKRKTTQDKLESIFLAIKKEKLTFGEFIHLASRHRDGLMVLQKITVFSSMSYTQLSPKTARIDSIVGPSRSVADVPKMGMDRPLRKGN